MRIGKSVVQEGIITFYEDDRWVVLKPFIVNCRRIGKTLHVPTWFPTDLASIPALGRPFFKVNGKHRVAAIVHDMLYSAQHCLEQEYTRKQADKIFLDIMCELGVNLFKAYAMYLAVRLGGLGAWKSKELLAIPVGDRLRYIDLHPSLSLSAKIYKGKLLY